MRGVASACFTLGMVSVLGGAMASCLTDPNAPHSNADVLDRDFFDCNVQPVLTRNCSMPACHGNGRRFFVVFARGRLRLAGNRVTSVFSDLERERNFEAASAMVVPGHPELSPLVMKPLEDAAGGWYHVGGEVPFHGGDPFTSVDDPGYQTLVEWVNGTGVATCPEPGSDL